MRRTLLLLATSLSIVSILTIMVLMNIHSTSPDRGGDVQHVTSTIVALPTSVNANATDIDRGHRYRVAILDSLYEWFPNDELIKTLVHIFRSADMDVDVYLGKEVGVELVKETISNPRYRVLIFRSHGGIRPWFFSKYVAIFTAEPFDRDKYRDLVRERALLIGRFRYGNEVVRVFAVAPRFVERFANLDRTVVVLASCYVGNSDELAKAFLSRGAEVVIAFRGKVELDYMDRVLIEIAKIIANHLDDPRELCRVVTKLKTANNVVCFSR